jgi:class 3 adenylate cyclase/tetratricopeptide (TPR) repeat protein
VSTYERKVITVLFADLVSFTSRAEQLDPEDVQAVLKPYHERLRYELERWGGTVEKFIGDAVVAFFGAPVAGEDDPERAVRAALAIRDWAEEEGVQVRVAVNTGEALVNLGARPESGEGMAAGDVVNTAARLQSAAPVNGILAGETTYRATSERIEYREHDAVEAKGKDAPVPVWEVVQARARFGVDLAGETRTPLVGRDRELDQLVDALIRSREQRSTELVTLVGTPGIGKSRLVGELFDSIDRGTVLTYWRQGRSLPYGEGVSYWALGEMVKAQAGVLETDSDEDGEAKLARTVEQLIDEDAEWVLSHLRPLVGQGEAAGSQEEAFAAWRRLFEAMAEQRPLVLVFEDIQWADDGLLDFIDHLADWVRDVPILILCTARLELLERRPAWGGGKVNAATVQLAPLSDEQTAKLISALGAEMHGELLERCGGNPLYAEQFARMLLERGESGGALPETVQGIIAARLDSLAPAEKALLQNAAVVGKVFWLGALGASEQQVHVLRQKEFVQRARRSSVEGEVEYAFKHVLVRDVAYGQIPRAERAQKHLRAAGWIEALGRSEDHAEMVAHHYVNALELLRAAGEENDELRARTVRALCEAGERALKLNALPQAEAYFRQALELTAAGDPQSARLRLRYGRTLYLRFETGAEELEPARSGLVAQGDHDGAVEASLMLADICWKRGDNAGMRRELDEALALATGAAHPRTQVAVLAALARFDMLAQRYEAALEHGGEALALAEQHGFDDLRAHALNSVGVVRANAGDAAGIAQLEESIELAARHNFISDLLRGHNNLIALRLLHGDFEGAREAEQTTLELSRQYGHGGQARFVEAGATIAHLFMRGGWDEALARAEAIIAEHEKGGSFYQVAGIYGFRGQIRLARDDDEGAVADAERTVELARAMDPQAKIPDFSQAAAIFALAGDEGRADETLSEIVEGISRIEQLGFVLIEAPHLMWAAVTLRREAEVLGRLERERFQSPWVLVAGAIARRDFHGAADLLAEIGVVAHEAFYRLQSGTAADVRAALDFYRRVRATRYIREAEALLATTA